MEILHAGHAMYTQRYACLSIGVALVGASAIPHNTLQVRWDSKAQANTWKGPAPGVRRLNTCASVRTCSLVCGYRVGDADLQMWRSDPGAFKAVRLSLRRSDPGAIKAVSPSMPHLNSPGADKAGSALDASISHSTSTPGTLCLLSGLAEPSSQTVEVQGMPSSSSSSYSTGKQLTARIAQAASLFSSLSGSS